MKSYIPSYSAQDYYQSMLNSYQYKVSPEESMKIPLFPLFEQENDREWNEDMEYMKQMYPKAVQNIQIEIEDQCDRLEYDGSCMFDQYPDRCHLGSIVDQIYNRITNETIMETESISMNSPYPLWSGHCLPNQPCRHDNNPDWLHNLIEVMLFNEMHHRRRRRRNRKKWF